MKKIITFALALIMMLSAAAFAETTFTQGFDYSYPPYSYLNDEGKMGGFDVEVCQAVCEYLGWDYAALPFNWDAKDGELQSGACDCIWSGFTIEGREDDYLWSIPYSNNTQVIVTMADSGITTLADLAGKLVGVQIDTSAQQLLVDEGAQVELAATFADLMTFETYTVAFNDMMAGAIDAVAVDITTATYILNNMDNPEDFVVLEEKLGVERYGIGFRMSDVEMRDQVNEALIALATNGTIEEIANGNPDYADIVPYLTLTAENAPALAAELEAQAE